MCFQDRANRIAIELDAEYEKEAHRNLPKLLTTVSGWNDEDMIKEESQLVGGHRRGRTELRFGHVTSENFLDTPVGTSSWQWGAQAWALGGCGWKVLTWTITGQCSTRTEVHTNALSNDPILRALAGSGGTARRWHPQGPRTYWDTEVTLSPGAFYHRPNTAEPQRMFQGQTDVDSVSPCLWHPCFLSSDTSTAEKWGKTRRERCWEPTRGRTVTHSLHFLSEQKDCTQRAQ